MSFVHAPCELRAATIAKKAVVHAMSIQQPVVPLSPPPPQPLAGTFSCLPYELPPPALRIFHGKGADGGGDSCSPRRPTIPTSASTVGSFSGAPFSPARPARLLFPAGAPVLATAGAQPLPISSSLLVIPWPNALATPASTPLRPPPCRTLRSSNPWSPPPPHRVSVAPSNSPGLPYLDLRATGASPYDKVCVMELPYSHAVGSPVRSILSICSSIL